MLNLKELEAHGSSLSIEQIQFKNEAASEFYRVNFKRALDICFSLTGLIVCTPSILLAGLLIMIGSSGPPVFRQNRYGLGRKAFVINKLRTMILPTDNWPITTHRDDCRITKIGKLLRATNIDELPQLINILKGDMSVIGPRPLSTEECDYIQSLGFQNDHPGFHLSVKPGLIGLEQINRHKKLDYIERFALNNKYEKELSAHLDLEIFIKAVTQCRWVLYLAVAGALIECIIACSFWLV